MKRLLFIVTEDWYFVSHRLHLAKAAIADGYRVAVLCRVGSCRSVIESAGIEVIDWNIDRSSLNPFSEWRALNGVRLALRWFKPDLIHAVALKPALYGALAGRWVGVSSSVYALGGLGFLFSSRKPTARLLRPIMLLLFRWMFRQGRTRLLLQNPDDCALLLSANVASWENIRLIRGAGVDTQIFSPRPFPSGIPLVILPARLLWSKGVGEFVAAARALKEQGVVARFALVGTSDAHNPECVPENQVHSWVAEGVIEAWGHREDMPEVYGQATIVCLPSYREGLPKALLEAASCARPIVTFDVPGCREVVEGGVNGLLVPFGDVEGLSQAVAKLIADPELCQRMGATGRDKVLREFSQERVYEETSRVWREVLA